MDTSPEAGAVARLRSSIRARFQLHEEWQAVLRHAWSIRLILLAGVFSGADVICTLLSAHPPFNPVWFAVLAGFVSMAALIARLVAQKSLGDIE